MHKAANKPYSIYNWGRGGGGQVVTFYSDDSSSNPAYVNNSIE